VRSGGEISELRWSGADVRPDGYAALYFIARNPVRVGPIAWKALQRYSDGSVVRWIGSTDSDTPAPVTTLSEDTLPVDVVSTHGESEPAVPAPASGRSSATAPAKEQAAAGNPGRDGPTLALAILGAVLGAAALGLTLRHRRG
jgi:hypothetical protein